MVSSWLPTCIGCTVTLAVAVLATRPAQAQKSSVPAATFTSRSEMVTVPVIVTDRDGVHIHNLKKEDFAVFEEGKEQPIAGFEEIQGENAPIQPLVEASGQFSNMPPGVVPSQPLTIVVLDLVNTLPADQTYARNELIKYLTGSANPTQTFSLLTVSRTGVNLVHYPSNDRKELIATLGKIERSQQPVIEEPSSAFLTNAKDKLSTILQDFGSNQVDSEQAALSLERRAIMTLTLDSLQQIAQAFAGFPGRKTLIWAGGGFPFTINETDMALKEGGAGLDTPANLLPLYEQTWAKLNQAQVSVYPVDVHGLGDLPGPATTYVHKPLPDPFTHGQWLHAGTNGTFELFARATAGRAYVNQNGLSTAIQEAVSDNASYYVLSYYLQREGKKPGWRKLTVKLRRDGAQVLARTGFFLLKSESLSAGAARDEMQIAMDSSLNYTAIPITAHWQEIRADTDPAKRKAIFILTMPPNFAEIDAGNKNHFSVEFWAQARSKTGASAGDTEQTMEGNFKPEALKQFQTQGTDYRGSISVAAGEYMVRFVVRDRRSGRIGTLSAPLKVAP
jgi:VWFA-related protein